MLIVITAAFVIVIFETKSGVKQKVAAAQSSVNATPTANADTPATNAQVTDTPASTGASSPPVASSAASAFQLQTYSGSGGLIVRGPRGWQENGSSGQSDVQDFDAPGSPAKLAGSTFRIGIGNNNPDSDIRVEGIQAAKFLRSEYHARILGGVTTGPFLDSEYADVQYEYFNATYNVERRGFERIWHDNGVTFIIQSSGLAGDIQLTQNIFRELIGHASVT